MRAIDDFLIDRIFQKIADALCWWRSCYGVAAFLMTGGSAVAIAGGIFVSVANQAWVLLTTMPLFAYWLIAQTRAAYRYDATWESGRATLPNDRIVHMLSRSVASLLVVHDALDLIFYPESTTPYRIGADLSWLAIVCGLYFIACTPKRPRRRRNLLLASQTNR